MTTTDLLGELLQKARVTPDLTEYLGHEQIGDAELFKVLFVDRAVFDHAEKKWYLWNDMHWMPDRTHRVRTFVGHKLAAEYLNAAESERRNGRADPSNQFIKRARLLEHLQRIRDVLALASSLDGIALDGSEWDTLPMILPVANGLIDLKTGEFRKAVPSEHLRYYAPTEWHGLHEPAPLWEGTLQEILGGDQAMVDFMQRLFGYSITGDTREQVLPILWGRSSNGKSTLMDVISSVLGDDFCFTTQADSLMDLREGDPNAARPFVCALRNKRLVWAPETKEGRRMNTALVKQLTGDRRITARALYGKPETFTQTHKIMLITNHCPNLPDGDDQAIWRRILRIPFGERFVEAPRGEHEHLRDRQLLGKLLSESSGILAWLVRGTLAWQQNGLNPPPAVSESTEIYRQEEDLIGHFVVERLLVRGELEVPAALVYKEYESWCKESGYRPMAARSLGQVFTGRFGKTVPKWTGRKTERVYQGIALLCEGDSLHNTELTEVSGSSA